MKPGRKLVSPRRHGHNCAHLTDTDTPWLLLHVEFCVSGGTCTPSQGRCICALHLLVPRGGRAAVWPEKTHQQRNRRAQTSHVGCSGPEALLPTLIGRRIDDYRMDTRTAVHGVLQWAGVETGFPVGRRMTWCMPLNMQSRINGACLSWGATGIMPPVYQSTADSVRAWASVWERMGRHLR